MTDITVTPIRPGPEITQSNTRQLNAALKLHYHIYRQAEDLVHEETKAILSGQKHHDKTLRRLIRRRDEAQEILMLYIQEQIRRTTPANEHA